MLKIEVKSVCSLHAGEYSLEVTGSLERLRHLASYQGQQLAAGLCNPMKVKDGLVTLAAAMQLTGELCLLIGTASQKSNGEKNKYVR